MNSYTSYTVLLAVPPDTESALQSHTEDASMQPSSEENELVGEALRAGLIGLGMMGRHHARVLSELDGVELVGIADLANDIKTVPSVQKLESVEQVVHLGVDMCVVATPTDTHLEIGRYLAAAKVPTLFEKPLAPTFQEATELVMLFAEADVIAGVGHIERFNPALQELRRRLENEALGDVYQIATRRQGPFPNRIRDVGVAKDLATHDIDLTAWLSDSRYADVSAAATYRSGRLHEDMLSASAYLETGTIVSHLVNWLSPLKERIVVVTGERGAFVADTLLADLTFCANGNVSAEWDSMARFRGMSEGNVVRFAIRKPEPLKVELEVFRDAILGAGKGHVPLHEAAAAVRVADAFTEAANSRSVVHMDWEG